MLHSFIEIHNMRMQAFHGVLPQEHVVGNLYSIDCTLEVDFSHAMQTDQLDDTVSYADVAEVIRQEMLIPSQLLEHVAGRIISQLQSRWSQQISHIDLRIAKQCPPITGMEIEECAVHLMT